MEGLFKIKLDNSQKIVNEAFTRKKTEANILLKNLGGFSAWERKRLLNTK